MVASRIIFCCCTVVFFFLLCSSEELSSEKDHCYISNELVDNLRTQITECQTKLNERGGVVGAADSRFCVKDFAFGVTVGVFLSLASIVFVVCCCVFRDRGN